MLSVVCTSSLNKASDLSLGIFIDWNLVVEIQRDYAI